MGLNWEAFSDQSPAMQLSGIISAGCLLFLTGGLSFIHAEEVTPAARETILSTSPDGRFQLRRIQADPGERGEARKTLEITSDKAKILYQWTSPLGITSANWSGDSRFLAVNDAPGDQGDQLRVFALDQEKQRVIPVREPDPRKLRATVESMHEGFLSVLEKVTLRSLEWKGERLWCQVTGTFSPKRQRGIHAPFHYLWVYGFHGESAPVLEEEWTRTLPTERPIRDSGQ
jgi:hypothetical protein